ncbi:GH24737 [Drosophila grimshawi]|uniref:GH24737 n=1 Tax=Drosophila grimshawi TaxID=7222 RepID=B4JN31_DROGR|nr:GH24737 [Drosophila grimshawi]
MHKCTDSDDKDPIIPVHGVNYETLLNIRRWMRFHKFDDVPDWVHFEAGYTPDDLELWTDEFDNDFLNISLSKVVEIMKGADFLDIPWLTKLCVRQLRIRNPLY